MLASGQVSPLTISRSGILYSGRGVKILSGVCDVPSDHISAKAAIRGTRSEKVLQLGDPHTSNEGVDGAYNKYPRGTRLSAQSRRSGPSAWGRRQCAIESSKTDETLFPQIPHRNASK
jgi:hypothetical protein